MDTDLKNVDLEKLVAIMNYVSGAAELIATLRVQLAAALAAPKASKKEIDEANEYMALAQADALTAKNSLAPLQAMLESDNARIAQINTLINGFVIPEEVGVVPETLLVPAELPTEVMDGSATDADYAKAPDATSVIGSPATGIPTAAGTPVTGVVSA